MNRLLMTLLTCGALGGCAQLTPYRTSMPAATDSLCRTADSPTQCAQQAYFLVAAPGTGQGQGQGQGEDIPMGVVEFDDQGVLQSRAAKDQIVDRIRQLTRDRGTLVVVFAHGWLNNAAPGNGNLSSFQTMLAQIAADDRVICLKARCAGRQVVGVFLGWRGESAMLQPFKALSFWNRKSRAERIGQDGATELVADLAKVRAFRGRTLGSGRVVENRLILIGHSFGGALLYSATQQLLMKDAASADIADIADSAESADSPDIAGSAEAQNDDAGAKPRTSSVDRTAANLVILVNPAFEAARFTALHDRAQTMSFPESQSAILAIFTSRTDLATKLAFPAGRQLSSLFTAYNPNFPEQAALDRTAIGHYAGYQTHDLSLSTEAGLATVQSAVCDRGAFASGKKDDWNFQPVILRRNEGLKRLGEKQLMNPYYNVAVDDAIISGHSGIWGPHFMRFLPLFLAAQKPEFAMVAGKPQPLINCPAP